jgi:LysM repeat protein
MSRKIGLIVLVVLALSLTACERTASVAPTATTVKNNFPQPLATTGMGVVEIAASQTAAALTGVPLGTPALVIDDSTATATPLGGLPDLSTATSTLQPGVDTALPSPTTDLGAFVTNTPQPGPTVQTSRPSTYTLQNGDFVFCLARRFNVDPDQILSLNGLKDSEVIYPGRTLQIPASGSFPGTRALKAHPATYIVQTGDTVYSIACQYGDVDPLNIASVNSLSAPYTLTVGAQIQIP